VRFKSEARFDRLVFNSETITVKEIIQHLVTKKKLGKYNRTSPNFYQTPTRKRTGLLCSTMTI